VNKRNAVRHKVTIGPDKWAENTCKIRGQLVGMGCNIAYSRAEGTLPL